MKHVAFIGLASGWGAQIRETEKGPDALQASGILSTLNIPWMWKNTLYPSKIAKGNASLRGTETLPYIEDLGRRLAHSVAQTLKEGHFPVVIGGDHSSAMGTWPGVTQYFKAQEEFGLIWIDAHMDAHTMETTPSQAYHGMPLATLLGFGEPSLVNLLDKGPVLNPAHLCLIGVRSYEEGEASLLQRLGARIYYIKDVEEKGFQSIFKDAVNHVKKGTKGFGLSIDLDAFDPTDAPGVGSPVSQGLKADEVLPVLSLVKEDPDFKALEIVEYNPDLDQDKKTIKLLYNLLSRLL